MNSPLEKKGKKKGGGGVDELHDMQCNELTYQ